MEKKYFIILDIQTQDDIILNLIEIMEVLGQGSKTLFPQTNFNFWRRF